MRNVSLRLLAFLLVHAIPLLAGAQAPSRRAQCTTPRAPVEGLLYWLQPTHYDSTKAAACLHLPPEKLADVGPRRAAQIKAVLDARGLFVEVDELPGELDYTNASGLHRHVLYPQLPELYVERVGEHWLWSAESIAAAPALYSDTFALDLDGLIARMPSWMTAQVFGVALWQLFGLLLLVFVVVLCRALVSAVVVTWARRMMRKLEAGWGDELFAHVGHPLGVLVGAGVGVLLLPELRFSVRLNQIGLLALQVMAAISAVWAVYRVVDLFTAWMQSRAEETETKLDDQLVPLVNKALKIFTIAVGAVFILQNLDVDVAGLLAGLGLGGLAFALAAKDTVANLFGSATIFAARPFHVGDWVVIGDADGTVESVGFRSTRIRTFYNSVVTVPNAKVADSIIDNYGARQYRRFKTYVGVTYDTTPEQLQAMVEGLRAMVEASPVTRKDYYHVYVNGLGPSSIDILLYVFFEVPSWAEELEARHDFILEVVRLAQKLKVEFAFPTQTLHVDTLATQAALPERAVPTREQLAETVAAFGPGGALAQPQTRPIRPSAD